MLIHTSAMNSAIPVPPNSAEFWVLSSKLSAKSPLISQHFLHRRREQPIQVNHLKWIRSDPPVNRF